MWLRENQNILELWQSCTPQNKDKLGHGHIPLLEGYIRKSGPGVALLECLRCGGVGCVRIIAKPASLLVFS